MILLLSLHLLVVGEVDGSCTPKAKLGKAIEAGASGTIQH